MKYLVYNDFHYLLKKRKPILIILLCFTLVCSLISHVPKSNLDTYFLISTGINLNDQSSFMELLIYLLNISAFIYLIIDIYVKDIKYQLDNIFLREKPFNWFWKKTIFYTITIFIIKCIQYLIITGVFLVFKDGYFKPIIVSYLITDYLYIILIGFIFLIIYVMFMIPKLKIVSVLIALLLIIIIPKDIWIINDKLLLIAGSIILIQTIISIVFKIKNKNLIENL